MCGTLLSARVPAATSKAHKVNVTSMAALLLAARKSSSVQRFVFLSTSELYYTGTGEGAIRMKEWYHKPSRAFLAESRPKDMAARGEWSALPMARQQGTAYAATKLRAEYLVQKAHLDGLSTVVLRPAPVLSGIGDADEVRAEDAPPLDERLLPLLSARRLLSLLAHRKLPLVGDGSACADVTHADNVAHAVALALRAKHETVSGRTYNVSADEPVRIVPLLQQLCERLTLPPPSAARSATSAWLRALLREAAAVAFRFVVRAPYESPTAAPSLRSLDVACLARHRLIDAAAAKRDLGYSPLVSTQEAVRRFADDVQRTMPPEMRQQFEAQLEAAKLKALGEEGLAKAKEVEKSKPPPPPPRTAAFDPAAGAPPPSAVSALREWAQRAPDRPALLFTRIALPSTLRRRVTLVTYLSLLLLCVVLEVIFAAREHAHRHELQRVASQPAEWDEAEDGRWEPHREPRPFGYRTLFRRATFTGVSDKLLLVLLALLLRLYFHPHRTPNHLRLLKTTWHALSYMQLASIVASMAHGLRKAGVQRGSTVFVLYESPTKAHAFALTLALQAVGATVIEGEPLTLGWRAYCKAVADARPDFVLSSRRVRLLLALLRPLSLLRLLPCAVPSGYRWARAAGLLTRSASGAIYLNNDELAEALPDPDDDAVAALRLGANDRAVWVSGGESGTRSGGAGGVAAILTPLPILHWMLRERARVYGEAAIARHRAAAQAKAAARAAAGLPPVEEEEGGEGGEGGEAGSRGAAAGPMMLGLGGCAVDAARWVSLHTLDGYAQHDLAYGACAALHPMGAHDPAANMEPALLHSMVNRLGATVLSAPPAVWRRLVAMLPAGALRSVCLPLTSGAYLPPHVFVSSNALMPAAKPPASSSCASSFASSFGLLAVYSSPEGLPFAACTSSDVLGGAAGIVGGKGVCVGRPLASGAAPGVSPGVYLDREVWATPGAPEAPRTHLANHKLMEAGSASPYAAVGAKPDPADVYGEIVISRPPAQGTPSRAAPAIAEVRTGEVGSIDATGRLWLHGRVSELVRTASMGTVPALDVESVVGATGLVRWAALVSAPLSSSASAAVLVVSLALTHPITGAPLKWGAEVRCDLREALKRSRWLPLSGSLRLLEFKGATPTDSATSSRLDRPLLRRWAAEALRGIGPEALKLDDRNDSLAMLKRNKVM